jgi:hypothetical protein
MQTFVDEKPEINKWRWIPQSLKESNVTTYYGKRIPVRSTCFLVLPSVPGYWYWRYGRQPTGRLTNNFFFFIYFFCTLFQGTEFICTMIALTLKGCSSPKPSLLFVVSVQYWNNFLYHNIYWKIRQLMKESRLVCVPTWVAPSESIFFLHIIYLENIYYTMMHTSPVSFPLPQ